MRVETFAHAKEIADYWAILSLTTRDGFTMRYGIYQAAQPRNGHVLILPDRDGFIEGYSELAEDFANRGWQVWCLEWRGQGRVPHVIDDESDTEEAIVSLDEVGVPLLEDDEDGMDASFAPKASRNGALSQRTEVTDWHAKCETDLEEFWIRAWLPETHGEPAIILTHAHGGHVALHWLIRHRSRKLGKTSFIFAAPTLGPRTLGLPLWMLFLLTTALHVLLPLSFPYPGQGRILRANRTFEGNLLTGDRIRFAILQKWREMYPELTPRKYSWGRLNDAIRSAMRLQRNLETGGLSRIAHIKAFLLFLWLERGDYLAPSGIQRKVEALRLKIAFFRRKTRILPPSLVLLAPDDKMTNSEAQYLLVDRFARARIKQFDGAKHDLLNERDEIRQRVWKEIDQFIDMLYGAKDQSAQKSTSKK